MDNEGRKPNLTLVKESPAQVDEAENEAATAVAESDATEDLIGEIAPWSTILDGERQALKTLHADMRFLIKGVPGAGLNWKPGVNTNSLWSLVLHTLGTTLHLLSTAADIDPRWQDWKRQTELSATGEDPALLLTAINNMDDFLDKVFPVVEDEDAAAAERDWLGKQRPVSWLMAHAVEHAGRHVGHMELTRQLWDQRQKRR